MSKIEVNTIEPQCGTTVTVGKCTSTVAVPGNVIKSNAVQASDGGNIVSQSGTDITLGASGDTVSLASGASQSGFGREGTVDWQTGSIKTGTFTAVTGEGYFVNTSGGTATVNLPAGAAGSIVAVADYTRTFNSNNCTVAPNGAEKIGGVAEDASLTVDGQSATFVYVDGTEGWINIQETETSQTGLPPFIVATGGTPCSGAIVCTDYKVHTFTGPGTLCVSIAGGPGGSNTVDYLVVAGGGGGTASAGAGNAGGGAGGYRESPGAASGCYTVSPLGVAPAAALPVSVQGYPITVGGGGAEGPCGPGACNGSNSIFSSITSTGGGAGGITPGSNAGGSGGGAGRDSNQSGGAGNTPPFTPAQGTAGGTNTGPPNGGAAGGGGALVAGSNPPSGPGPSPAESGGPGGGGATSSIDGTPTARAGGGGAGTYYNNGPGNLGCGGAGGGGAGGLVGISAGGDGTVNTGSGGGGGGPGGGDGGSGVVIIRYKFQ